MFHSNSGNNSSRTYNARLSSIGLSVDAIRSERNQVMGEARTTLLIGVSNKISFRNSLSPHEQNLLCTALASLPTFISTKTFVTDADGQHYMKCTVSREP